MAHTGNAKQGGGLSSADCGIEFTDLGACVEFLSLILRNRQTLSLNRNDIVGIVASGSTGKEYFTILIRGVRDSRLRQLQKLARVPGKPVNARQPPEGKSYTVNGLLERIRLIPRMQSPRADGVAIALFGADDDQYRDWHTQLLDMGCRHIRVGSVEPCADNDNLSHLFLIDQVPVNFVPPSDWILGRNSRTARALAFYPLGSGPDCQFYIEWDYEHPLGDVDNLYDTSEAQCRFVMICAGSPRNRRLGTKKNVPATLEPRWLRIDDHELGGMFQALQTCLTLPHGASVPVVPLKSRRPCGEAVLDFRVKRDSPGATATVESIEKDIAWHQRAIDELARDHRAAHLVRHEKVYLAFAFHQTLPAEGDKANRVPALNPSFRSLLEQPYSHLEHMKYGFYENLPSASADRRSKEAQRHGLHVVIDSRPGTHSQLFTQLADEVFIQRADWHEWGLPLFVRYGDEIRPRLEDEALVPLIRKLLWKDPEHPEESLPESMPLLLRTFPRDRDQGREGRQPWEVLCLTDLRPLTSHECFRFIDDRTALSPPTGDECFRFINDRFSVHLLKFRKEIPEDIAQRLATDRSEVTKQAVELEEQVIHAAEDGVTAAEQRWQQVDDRIKRIGQETRRLTGAVGKIESTIKISLATWSKFFLDVIASNRSLAQDGVTAFDRYRTAHDGALKKLGEYERGLVDVDATLKKDNENLAERRAELDRVDEACHRSEAQLKTSMQQVAARQRTVEARVVEVNGKVEAALVRVAQERARAKEQLGKLDSRIAELKKERRLRQEEQNRLSAREAEIKRLGADNARLARENEETAKRIETMDQTVKRERAELKEREAELQRDFAKHRAQLAEVQARRPVLDKQRARLNQEIKQFEPKRAKLEADQVQFDQALKHLQAEKARLGGVAKELENRKKEIVDLREKNRTEHDRIKVASVKIREARTGAHREYAKLREKKKGLVFQRLALQKIHKLLEQLDTVQRRDPWYKRWNRAVKRTRRKTRTEDASGPKPGERPDDKGKP